MYEVTSEISMEICEQKLKHHYIDNIWELTIVNMWERGFRRENDENRAEYASVYDIFF